MLALKALWHQDAGHQHIHTRDTEQALPGALCSHKPLYLKADTGHFWKDLPLHLLGVSIRQLQASPTDCKGPAPNASYLPACCLFPLWG